MEIQAGDARVRILVVPADEEHEMAQQSMETLKRVKPHGQEPAASMVQRNPPKLQSSFAKTSDFAEASPDRSEDICISPRPGNRDVLRRRAKGRNRCSKRSCFTGHRVRGAVAGYLLLGQLYPAILIARLVSLSIGSSRKTERS